MSDVLDVLETKSLEEKLEDALDIDATITNPKTGEATELSDHIIESMKVQNVADTITKHIYENALQIPEVQEATLQFGSGDTGRQSKLSLTPEDDVSKDELLQVAEELDSLLAEIFPTEYIVGITHGFTIDDDGHSKETDDFCLYLVYQVRSHGSPSKPPGDKTIAV